MSDKSPISTYHISTPKTARIATAGTITSRTKNVWIACHGYGEIASEFIASMQDIVDDETYIVAPEALSKFYWGGGFDGKPVASWMTREDRLNEINDYAHYLTAVLDDVRSKVPKDVRIILLGFSQGAATIMRWVNAIHPLCDAIVIWSGMIPEDIDYDAGYHDGIRMYNRYGDQDRFINDDRLAQHLTLMDEKGLTVDTQSFVGKHKIYGAPLRTLAEKVYSEIE